MTPLLLAAFFTVGTFCGAFCLSRFRAARRHASALNAYAALEITRQPATQAPHSASRRPATSFRR